MFAEGGSGAGVVGEKEAAVGEVRRRDPIQ